MEVPVKDTVSEGGALVKKQWFVQSKLGKIEDSYDWTKKRTLGSGQFGSVVSAKIKNTKLDRAIKIIPKSRVRDQKEFQREINIMKELDHPNIVRIFETYEDQRNVYLVMELCSGGELFDLLVQRKKFNEEEARKVFIQIALAVSYCHSKGICHRDLKPENFLLCQKESTDSVKVADFGLSCIFQDKSSNQKQQLLGRTGSSYYMSPEILKGQYTELCDCWSLGVILYILLSGIPPFSGISDTIIFDAIEKGEFTFDIPQFQNVSNEAKDLISKCLVKESDRLTSSQIIQHPWCKKVRNVPLVSGIELNNMKNFSSNSKLKKVALTFIASQLSEAEIINLSNLFKSLDKNGDGVLSVEEISEGVKELDGKEKQLYEILSEIDTDKSGQIEYTEFLASSIDKSLFIQQEKLYNAFKSLDINNNGSISMEELKNILGQEGQFMSHSSEYWKNIIKEADKDKNGEIDYQEFVEMMNLKQ